MGRRREVLRAASGLLVAGFVGALAGTLVTNALPKIFAELGGSQSQYAWVVAATLLAATASSPIWGKLADRMSRKRLMQGALLIFTAGSVLSGFVSSVDLLLGLRVLQGVGVGGLLALPQVVMASLVSARERGRYIGYFAASGTIATVAGPPLGGIIVDAPFLGWRWCFWIVAPVALVAMLLLQRTLRVPEVRGDGPIDWRGTILIPIGVGVVLIWATFVDEGFEWVSWPSAGLVGVAILLIVLAVYAESRAKDPIVPPRLVFRRTMILTLIVNIAVGSAMVSAAIFMAQYFQVARGFTPTQSGLLTLPLMAGMMVGASGCGWLVSRSGRWKRVIVASTGLAFTGLSLLATMDAHSSLVLLGAYQAILGIGFGGCMPNLVLAVQNDLDYGDLGSGTSMIMFFRSLGGAAGIAVLGALMASDIRSASAERLASEADAYASLNESSQPPNLSSLPGEDRAVLTEIYSEATALVFQVSAALAAVAVIAVFFIREKPLKTRVE